jgi:pyruvate-ferredoxin/flavodoxin oxidoreductase
MIPKCKDRRRAAAWCVPRFGKNVASHALNIFGDHSDVYACRQTGFAMLAEDEYAGSNGPRRGRASGGDQRQSAVFINFFDGFRTLMRSRR